MGSSPVTVVSPSFVTPLFQALIFFCCSSNLVFDTVEGTVVTVRPPRFLEMTTLQNIQILLLRPMCHCQRFTDSMVWPLALKQFRDQRRRLQMTTLQNIHLRSSTYATCQRFTLQNIHARLPQIPDPPMCHLSKIHRFHGVATGSEALKQFTADQRRGLIRAEAIEEIPISV